MEDARGRHRAGGGELARPRAVQLGRSPEFIGVRIPSSSEKNATIAKQGGRVTLSVGDQLAGPGELGGLRIKQLG
jgi:hypothetical protein